MAEKKNQDGVKFTKSQILSSAHYAGKRDLISALLTDGETYSAEQVDRLIENYMKGGVN